MICNLVLREHICFFISGGVLTLILFSNSVNSREFIIPYDGLTMLILISCERNNVK